jgi:hypothetical protein
LILADKHGSAFNYQIGGLMLHRALVIGSIVLVAAGCGSGRSDSARRGQGGAAIPKGWETRSAAGELLADASAIPGLPAFVDLETTELELGAHALIAAREDVARGNLNDADVAKRHLQIYSAWLPLMKEKQAYLQQIIEDRKPPFERQVQAARLQAEHEREMAKVNAEYDRKITQERLKTVAIAEE